MIRLLKFLLTGDWHLHTWEEVQKYEYSNHYSKGIKIRHKCKICGKTKIETISSS